MCSSPLPRGIVCSSPSQAAKLATKKQSELAVKFREVDEAVAKKEVAMAMEEEARRRSDVATIYQQATYDEEVRTRTILAREERLRLERMAERRKAKAAARSARLDAARLERSYIQVSAHPANEIQPSH